MQAISQWFTSSIKNLKHTDNSPLVEATVTVATICIVQFAGMYLFICIVRKIRGEKIDPNKKKKGLTPLMTAAMSGNAYGISKLLKAKADPNLLSDSKNTALILAIYNHHHPSVLLLLDPDLSIHTDLSIHDKNQRTPLIIAANIGESKILKTLISHKADLNAQDVDGNTALICAAKKGNIENVDLLLEARADLTLRNRAEESALVAAVQGRHTKIVSRLKEKS